MSDSKLKLLFDTSGLNALADEPQPHVIVKSLGVGFQVLLSETNITEIVATRQDDRRRQLLSLCQHLIHEGQCIKPQHWIVQELARQHYTNPNGLDWRGVNMRFRELEKESREESSWTTPE